jgi:hypothetical protein
MLALTAAVVLAPLLYIPGYLLMLALLGASQPPDPLERHYERVVAGALLNGWLALLLAELVIFSAGLHLALVAAICAICALAAGRRGLLRLPNGALGISFHPRRPAARTDTETPKPGDKEKRVGLFAFSPGLRVWWRVINPYWEAIAFAGVGLLFAVLVARPFEVVLGARDAGVYATTGFAIARYGGIVQYDPLLQQIDADQHAADPQLRAAAEQAETNFLGIQSERRFIATRMRFAGYLVNQGDLSQGRVTSQFLHLYPAWIGLLAGLLGLRGGLLATGLLGLLGVWSVGMLGRRLAGTWVGLLGMLFLALNGVQVWFSRYSTSEACAQFLTFAALYFFAVMQDVPERSNVRTIERSTFAGLLAGVAAGQLALTRIDFFVLVAPLLAYLAYVALTKRWARSHTALAGGLGAMLIHAALHIVFISRAYFLDTLYARLQDQSAIVARIAYLLWTPALRQQFLEIPRAAPLRAPYRLPLEIALVVVLVAAFVLLRRDGRPQRWFERQLLRFRRGLLNLGMLAILLLGIYGYFIRPQILTWQRLAAAPSCALPGPARAAPDCLALQGYIGAPIASPAHPNVVAYSLGALPKLLRGAHVPPRVAAEFSPGNPGESEKIGIAQANLVRVGWYISPLGVLLGVVGFALWFRRGLSPASWLFLATSLISTIFFVRLSYGATDLTYIYILRRYMPVTYPALCLGMAYAIVALWGSPTFKRSNVQTFKRWVTVGIVVLLVGFLGFTNRTLYRHVEYAGALDQLEALAGRFEPGAVLLFRGEGRDTPDLVTTPLKYAFGLDTFAIRSADPGKYAADLARYVERWQAQGRQVYLVLGANGGVELPGLRPVPAGPAVLRLPEFQQLRDQKPSLPQEFDFDFAIYRLEPAARPPAPRPIAVDDYTAQLRGFYHPEQIDGGTVAWTNGDTLLRLAWPQGNAPLDLVVNLAPGASRPASLGPARACVAFQPAATQALADAQFVGEQCFDLSAGMAGYHYLIDPRSVTTPASGTFLLRITSSTWIPAEADPALHDQRQLGVQFGGITVGSSQ